MNLARVVIWDQSGEYMDGAVIGGDRMVDGLEKRHALVLPVDQDRAHSDIEGYFRRGWGKGWAFARMQPERGCPMLMWCVPDRQFIYWGARVIVTGPNPQGIIRLTTNSAKQTAYSGGLSATESVAVRISDLGAPDRLGGWTVRGRHRISVATEGYAAFGIYGVAQDIAIVVSAITQSRAEAQV